MILAVASVLCAAIPGLASDLKLIHARIYTSPDVPSIPDGAILIHDDKIVALGPTASIKGPRLARAVTVYDCTGLDDHRRLLE